MKSWRTTTFGLIGAIGAAVVTAIRTGVIDGSQLPGWVNAVAGLCSIVGSVGLGFAARDNKVTSEQAGANPPPSENPNP